MKNFALATVSISLEEYNYLKESEKKLQEGSTISGLTPEEYGEASAMLVERALQTPEVFGKVVEFNLQGKYIATVHKVAALNSYTIVVQFRKV